MSPERRGFSHSRIGGLGLACVVFCLLAIPISGCGVTSPTPEPARIAFAHRQGETDFYQALVQKFNESYPHITVELQGPGAFKADVFLDLPFSANERQKQDEILSLDSFIEQDESFDLGDFYPGTVELFTSEGKTLAIPSGVNTLVMFYNQDLFDQYDVSYPEIGWTWDEFLNAALAIRDPDASIFGYTGSLGSDSPDAVLFIYQHGGRIFDDLQNPTRTTFDDPLTIEALEWYARLINKHNVAPTPEQARRVFGTSGSGIYRGILQNKVGMWIGWFAERGGLTWPVEWYMRWGVVPVPRDAQSVTMAMAEGYFISAETQHPDACWQWIAFLSRQMPSSMIPSRKSVAESTAYEQQVGSEVASVARASIENAELVSPELAEFGENLDLFFRALDNIINERSTPEEAMSWAQREFEKRKP